MGGNLKERNVIGIFDEIDDHVGISPAQMEVLDAFVLQQAIRGHADFRPIEPLV